MTNTTSALGIAWIFLSIKARNGVDRHAMYSRCALDVKQQASRGD